VFRGRPETPPGTARGRLKFYPRSRGKPVPPQTDDPEPAPSYQLELRVRLTKGSRAWDASLEGTTPEGRPLERREFESLMDLMRFLEALVLGRGLR
jgi:hypothetical protein